MYAEEKGSTVFVVYSTSDADDPTVLYGSRGKEAEQDHEALMQHMEGRRNNANRSRSTLNRLLETIERKNGNGSNGVFVTTGGTTTIGDVSLPVEERGGNGRRDFSDGTQDSRNAELTEHDKEASEEFSDASSVTWSNDYAAIRNFVKDGDSEPKYSKTKADTSYMDAVNRGDMKTAQKMANEAAKNMRSTGGQEK